MRKGLLYHLLNPPQPCTESSQAGSHPSHFLTVTSLSARLFLFLIDSCQSRKKQPYSIQLYIQAKNDRVLASTSPPFSSLKEKPQARLRVALDRLRRREKDITPTETLPTDRAACYAVSCSPRNQKPLLMSLPIGNSKLIHITFPSNLKLKLSSLSSHITSPSRLQCRAHVILRHDLILRQPRHAVGTIADRKHRSIRDTTTVTPDGASVRHGVLVFEDALWWGEVKRCEGSGFAEKMSI